MILHFTITQKTKTLYYLETTSLNIGNSISLNNQTTQSTNHKIPQYFSQYCYQSIKKKKPICFTPSSFFNFILLPKSKNNFSVKFQPFAKLPTSKNSNDENIFFVHNTHQYKSKRQETFKSCWTRTHPTKNTLNFFNPKQTKKQKTNLIYFLFISSYFTSSFF